MDVLGATDTDPSCAGSSAMDSQHRCAMAHATLPGHILSCFLAKLRKAGTAGGSALRSWSRDYPTSAVELDAVSG